MIGSGASRPPFPVTLDNWQTAGQLEWTFQHMAEIFPTVPIARGAGHAPRLPSRTYDPDRLAVLCNDGRVADVDYVIANTDTDGWMVVHDHPQQGPAVLVERYRNGMEPSTLHLLMSVSKSVVGTVIGALAAQGVVDVEAPVTYYIPAFHDRGYAGATVRNLLDMRSGIKFSEEYLDPWAEVRVLEQAFGWAPRLSPDVPGSLRDFLLSLRQARPHGQAFDYRSCETDVLGWVIEAATGMRFAQVASDLVWSRIGAEFDANIGVDSEGSGMYDGGISATLGDIARFGLMILRSGTSLTGAGVVPPWWIEDSFAGGPDSVRAFAESPGDNRMPGGLYRNQFWIPDASRPVLLCLGIHGQMIYVNRAARVVAAKLSSWPTPQDAWRLFSTVSAFDSISADLAASMAG
ncbi:serine hydrolase [Microlunatus ginsengisoli]|uniref:Serine hydrolase n=1 Tax=Microlunatus ginsengisoli TaxID=363863 RepID=A0ABP6ZIH9_9ACTN